MTSPASQAHRVSRPRRPSDPDRWPEPCGRCGEHHQIAATWPDARVCGYCYQAAKRITGTCACGHQGILPGRAGGRPACRRCSGVGLNLDCAGCGAEAELHSGGRWWACVLGAAVDRLLTSPQTGAMAAALQPVAAALKSMTRANSGLTWINQRHVQAFLAELAVRPAITHDTLDALSAHPTREYVRGLLVEHGALPRRDERRVRYQAWSEQALQRLPDGQHRDLMRRFIRWHLLRRMNAMATVSEGTFLQSKQTVTVAIDFLTWLTGRGLTLAQLTQADLDAWQASGPTTREAVTRFLRWAINTRLVSPDLTTTPHRRGTSPKLGAASQDTAIQQVVHGGELSARDRLAAILVIVFGQQIADVVGLTWTDVTLTGELATITLGTTAIALPPPLDDPLRQLARIPTHSQTSAHPNSPWIFRGNQPGQHITAARLRQRLTRVFSARAARLGALHELTKLAPIPVIAEALGYAPATIERHAIGSASTYSQYVAVLREPAS
jgi:integrase